MAKVFMASIIMANVFMAKLLFLLIKIKHKKLDFKSPIV